MSDRLQGGILAGSTSLSIPVFLRKTADGTEQTGIAAASVTSYFIRQGDWTVTQVTMSDLAAINSAYSSGGWKEASSTNMKGMYRYDVPSTAITSGADWALGTIQVSGCFSFPWYYSLTSNKIQTGDVYALATGSGVLVNSATPINANVVSLNGDSAAAITQALMFSSKVVYSGTVTSAASVNTQIIDSGLNQTDTGFWSGRTVIFTSVPSGGQPLVLQATKISGYTTGVLTIDAITRIPSVGTTYVIV